MINNLQLLYKNKNMGIKIGKSLGKLLQLDEELEKRE